MKNILICVDSVFQFIIASNLRVTIYKDSNVDLVIYNSYPSAHNLYDNVKNVVFFDKVYFADTVLTYCGKNYTFREKFPKYYIYIKSLIEPKKVLNRILKMELETKYDHFIFNGDGALPECVFNVCLKKNKELKCYRIEDGYYSYVKEFGKDKSKFRIHFEKVMHNIFGTKNIRNYIEGYYLSEPDLAQINYPYPKISIPKFTRDNNELVSFLNLAFNYDISNNDQFKNKIIYFEGGASFFDGNDEELKIMRGLVKMIPKEKILVKRHPRRKEDRFASMGISCCTVNGVPWEVIQMNCTFDGQSLICSCSSTIYNSDIYFGDSCTKVFTYRLMDNPPFVTKAQYFESFLGAFHEKFGENSVICPGTYEELNTIKFGED